MRYFVLLALLLLCQQVQAYTVIIPSTSAPAGTEQALIAQATNYFNATVVTNPLFQGTYQIALYGPAKSNFQMLIDSGTYSFVFGEGMETERAQDLSNITGPDTNCDASTYCMNASSLTAPSNFKTYASTYTVTISSTVCQAVVCRIAADIYLQNFTPP